MQKKPSSTGSGSQEALEIESPVAEPRDDRTRSLSDSERSDPATTEDAKLDRLEPVGPQRLYYIWEQQQWTVGTLDFAQDREDWWSLHEDRRTMLIESLAPFCAGEERVANAFSPIVMAADDDQELAFLATQQVDEARHMQFFQRFWHEVFVPDKAVGQAAVADARARCNDAYTELFDRRLVQTVDRLRNNPRDTAAKVEAVTIYHLLIEGVLALTAMHFVADYFEKNSILPTIGRGLINTKKDEHRHIAWGTWYLRQKCREDDRYGFIVQSTLMELMPVAAGIMVEGGIAHCDGLDPCEFLDYPSAALNHYALTALSRRLKVIGGATQEIQQFAASGAWRASRVL